MPTLNDPAANLVRVAYGALLLWTLCTMLPQASRFLASERWGGYIEDSPHSRMLHGPTARRVALAIWFASAMALTVGWGSVFAALVNVVFCRHYFVQLRWKSILRGMGAPGFLTYWLGLGVLLIEFSRVYSPALQPLVLLVLAADFSAIMLSAGMYKLAAGYRRNEGMEYGLVNPLWGYWWRAYRRLRPDHWSFFTLNQLGWSTEIAGAILLLLPGTRVVGALIFAVSFAFVATQIRLGALCEMVILAALMFAFSGAPFDGLAAALGSALPGSTGVPLPFSGVISAALTTALLAYLVLLPAAHLGLWFNFYLRRRLPFPVQRLLELYTNVFGIIIWRVFSVDLINFITRIYVERNGSRTLVSSYGDSRDLRFTHVGELITVTSLFTTLKYYQSNEALFRERLVRYSRTLPCPPAAVLVFAYVSISKSAERFEEIPAVEYIVEPRSGRLETRVLSEAVSVNAAHKVSPVHEGARPGSYAPRDTKLRGAAPVTGSSRVP